MEYPCKLVPVLKVLSTPKGLFEPLCNSCKTKDCTNPVEEREISILGVNKKFRMYMRGDDPCFVIQCNEGYTTDDNEEDDI
jgi:hypothetical protein